MHIQFDKLRIVGPKAISVALIGTILPVVLGVLFTYLLGAPAFPDGLSVGASLAPTSVS